MITETAIVALPTEGVDRNLGNLMADAVSNVALPTEGVDRNLPYQWAVWTTARRPPHGGRG